MVIVVQVMRGILYNFCFSAVYLGRKSSRIREARHVVCIWGDDKCKEKLQGNK